MVLVAHAIDAGVVYKATLQNGQVQVAVRCAGESYEIVAFTPLEKLGQSDDPQGAYIGLTLREMLLAIRESSKDT